MSSIQIESQVSAIMQASLEKMMRDAAIQVVMQCAELYGFNAEEAMSKLTIDIVKSTAVTGASVTKTKTKSKKSSSLTDEEKELKKAEAEAKRLSNEMKKKEQAEAKRLSNEAKKMEKAEAKRLSNEAKKTSKPKKEVCIMEDEFELPELSDLEGEDEENIELPSTETTDNASDSNTDSAVVTPLEEGDSAEEGEKKEKKKRVVLSKEEKEAKKIAEAERKAAKEAAEAERKAAKAEKEAKKNKKSVEPVEQVV